MAQTWSKREIEQADLVVVVDKEGNYSWSANRSNTEVIGFLAGLIQDIAAESK